MKAADTLARCPLFDGLQETQLWGLAQVGVVRPFKPHVLVFEENDKGDSFFVVVDGFVSIGKLAPESRGEERCLAILASGDFFGEMALLDGGLRSARARTLTPATLMEFDQGAFHEVLDREPRTGAVVSRNLARLMSQRIRATNDMVAELMARAARTERQLKAMREGLSGDVTIELRQFLAQLEKETGRLRELPEFSQGRQKELVGLYQKHLEEYSRSVNEMLTLVDLCYGHFQPQLGRLAARSMADKVIAQVREEAQARGISLRNEMPQGLTYDTDARLKLALLEMVRLLVQRATRGQSLSLWGDERGVALRLSPLGLPPEVVEQIFEDMATLDRHIAPHGRLGVGFALAKELIEAQGGRIEIFQEETATVVSLTLTEPPPEAA